MSGRKVAECYQVLSSKIKGGEFSSATNNIVCGVTDSAKNFDSQALESISPHLNERGRSKLTQLLRDFADVFDDKLDQCNITSHRINTGGNTPIKHRPQRLPYAYREESERQIHEMLEDGIIQHS
jgi:hypothetical protein